MNRGSFLSRLEQEQRATIAGQGSLRIYRQNDRIAEATGLIMSGIVRREQYSDALSEPVLSTAFYGPGELVGLEEAFLPAEQETTGAEYRAHTNVGVLQVPYSVFCRFAAEDAPLAVMQEQAARAKKAFIDQARAAMSVQDRLGTFLLDLARRFGVGCERDGLVKLNIELSQEQIAQAIGASRPAVELELKKLRAGGYVQTSYRSLALSAKFMAGGPNGTWCS